MREFLRQNRRFVSAATLAAFALRLFLLFQFPYIAGDSFTYGDLAKNWIQHGIFGFGGPTGPVPTLIRLPGYPAFLALVWSVFGIEHYTAVMVVQIFLDVGTCFLVAALARELVSVRAARLAFLIAALCPFTANFAATPLAETPEIFFSALALLCAAKGLRSDAPHPLRWWAGCGAALAACILLRPDGGVLLMAIGGLLFVRWARGPERRAAFLAGVVMAAASFAPLVPWTIRNWQVFHVFQPLAPRHATAPGEFVPLGYERWLRTWVVDYSSTEEVYWAAKPVDIEVLPPRAFDSDDQRRRTEELLSEYEPEDITPAVDAKFALLADERIRSAPLRYYLFLPAARVADMWLRPRIELLGLDTHWWDFENDPGDSAISIALGLLNLALVAAAVVGAIRGRAQQLAMLVGWILLRSALLATLPAPEPRYTLECYPVLFLLAAANLRSATQTP
ncbi:MAG TPA: glycosyltransferase family 39 protein [Terriglobales bacterium]|nr:glycosyltransferase family 39 protein [Terriglobales bacterium]